MRKADTIMNDIITEPFKGKVSTESGSLTIRDNPSTSSKKNGTLEHNSTSHKFSGYYLEGSSAFAEAWLLVYVNGTGTPKGFVSARYITWLPSYGVGSCSSTTVNVASGEYVNLRQKASKSSSAIGKLHKGDKVLILYKKNSPNDGWTQVATAEGTGWIMTKFLN